VEFRAGGGRFVGGPPQTSKKGERMKNRAEKFHIRFERHWGKHEKLDGNDVTEGRGHGWPSRKPKFPQVGTFLGRDEEKKNYPGKKMTKERRSPRRREKKKACKESLILRPKTFEATEVRIETMNQWLY